MVNKVTIQCDEEELVNTFEKVNKVEKMEQTELILHVAI